MGTSAFICTMYIGTSITRARLSPDGSGWPGPGRLGLFETDGRVKIRTPDAGCENALGSTSIFLSSLIMIMWLSLTNLADCVFSFRRKAGIGLRLHHRFVPVFRRNGNRVTIDAGVVVPVPLYITCLTAEMIAGPRLFAGYRALQEHDAADLHVVDLFQVDMQIRA
jgi:hypothetical protein